MLNQYALFFGKMKHLLCGSFLLTGTAVMAIHASGSVNFGFGEPELHSGALISPQARLSADPDSPFFAATSSAAPNAVLLQEKIARKKEYTFSAVDRRAYLLTSAYARTAPYEDAEGLILLDKYQSVSQTGENDMPYQEISVDGRTLYLHRDNFTNDKQTIIDMKAEDARQEELRGNWTGSILTRSSGVNYGPSGKETYYNLPMDGVVSIMRSMGNTDPYWEREDGCKMLGDYIMVAADLSVHPRGSVIPTSLGSGLVCDTGSFISNGSGTCVDIAVNW